MKRLILICTLFTAVACLYAQRVQVAAPSHVMVGEEFQIEYTINTRDVRNFHIGSLPSGLECRYGPFRSEQSSFQVVNGHTTSSSSVSVAYVLIARKSGTFTIPPARFHSRGNNLASTPIKIVASGGHASSQGYGAHGQDEGYEEEEGRQQASSGNELFIKVFANKTHVREQEAVLLTYKVYTTVNLVQLDGKMPDLKGCHVQEVKLPQQKSFHTETYKGRRYNCVTWSQYVVYPQITGKITIPPITFQGIVRQENRSVDPFEAFIDGAGYRETKRNIKADGITIKVDPLPTKPSNFSGGVGSFNISGQLTKAEVKAGEPVTLRIVIGGTGNLKLIQQPKADFPQSFDKYDTKVTDKTRLTDNGIEGNIVYDLLAVPRKEGDYTIPPVSFTYFDMKTQAYKTISTHAFKLKVLPGDNAGEVNDFTEKPGDIRPIKSGSTVFENRVDFFFGSAGWWTTIVLLIIVLLAVAYTFRKRAKENGDFLRNKRKNANKVATIRLQKANQLMLQGNAGEFFDEVLRALWGYIGDRLNMEAEQLNREHVATKLHELHIDGDTIRRFIGAIDECEFERYAPGDAKGNMNRTIEAAMTAITQIENAMEQNQKGAKTRGFKTLLVVMLCLMALPSQAVTKQMGDKEYTQGNYLQAVKDYNDLLQHGVSADVYYNLGNAYYRLDDIPHAILAYERALLLAPGDGDIRFNLQVARAKTIDKITPQSQLFFVTGYRALVNFMPVDAWAVCGILSLVLLIVALAVFLTTRNRVRRTAGRYAAISLGVFFLLSTLFAWQQQQQLENHCGAIVMGSSVSVKKSPDTASPDQFVIHEGTKVFIKDRGITGWFLVQLEDGREGWLTARQIEEI